MRLPPKLPEFEFGELDSLRDEPNERYWLPLLPPFDEEGRFTDGDELPLEKEPEGRATLLRAPELLLKLPLLPLFPRELLGSEKLCHPFWLEPF